MGRCPLLTPNDEQFTESHSGWTRMHDNEVFGTGLLNAYSWGCSGYKLCVPVVPVGPITAASPGRTVPQTPGQWEEEQIWLEGWMVVVFALGLHPNPHTGLGLGCLAGRDSRGPGQGEPVFVPLSGEWGSTCRCHTGLLASAR